MHTKSRLAHFYMKPKGTRRYSANLTIQGSHLPARRAAGRRGVRTAALAPCAARRGGELHPVLLSERLHIRQQQEAPHRRAGCGLGTPDFTSTIQISPVAPSERMSARRPLLSGNSVSVPCPIASRSRTAPRRGFGAARPPPSEEACNADVPGLSSKVTKRDLVLD